MGKLSRWIAAVATLFECCGDRGFFATVLRRNWNCLEKMDAENRSFSLLFVSLFKGHRGNTAERAVTPRSVVERLDVIEDGKFGREP